MFTKVPQNEFATICLGESKDTFGLLNLELAGLLRVQYNSNMFLASGWRDIATD